MQAGDATMMEYDANQKLNYKRQTYAPTTFGSKTITTTQTKRSTYAKEFLSTYFSLVDLGHHMWRSTFQIELFSDNRSVPIFTCKIQSSSTVELIRLCITIEHRNRQCRWFNEYCS